MTRLALLHPFPSLVDAAVVLGLALMAGATIGQALWLSVGMLGFQISIGALNDLVDARADLTNKPGNPVAAGTVDRRVALGAVLLGAVAGTVVSATFGLTTLLVGLVGYACGVLYDVVPRLRRDGWLCFAVAIPLLLAWPWLAVTGDLPPGSPALLAVAALAGPMLHLSNALVDREGDTRSGRGSMAVRLEGRGPLALGLLVASVYGLAWALLIPEVPTVAIPVAILLALTLASIVAAMGVWLSASASVRRRERGWRLQAVAIAVLALAWVAAVSS